MPPHEPTAAALLWACYLLQQHPKEQELLAAEVSAMGVSPENAAKVLPELVQATVNEVLRLYPAAFMIVRHAPVMIAQLACWSRGARWW